VDLKARGERSQLHQERRSRGPSRRREGLLFPEELYHKTKGENTQNRKNPGREKKKGWRKGGEKSCPVQFRKSHDILKKRIQSQRKQEGAKRNRKKLMHY